MKRRLFLRQIFKLSLSVSAGSLFVATRPKIVATQNINSTMDDWCAVNSFDTQKLQDLWLDLFAFRPSTSRPSWNTPKNYTPPLPTKVPRRTKLTPN